jgi:hypothetical protein
VFADIAIKILKGPLFHSSLRASIALVGILGEEYAYSSRMSR